MQARMKARSVECRSAQSEYTAQQIQAKADKASRDAWRDGRILIISADHPALDWAERLLVERLAKRIGAAS